jgi:hypothetical protein
VCAIRASNTQASSRRDNPTDLMDSYWGCPTVGLPGVTVGVEFGGLVMAVACFFALHEVNRATPAAPTPSGKITLVIAL